VLPAILGASLLLLFLLPLLALATYAPPAEILDEATNPGVLASLSVTLLASAIALGITLLLGVPLGYLLARRSFRGRSLVHSVVTLPLVLPHLVAGLAILLLFSPASPVGALAIRLGLPVFETLWGVVLVMVYVSASYTVLSSELAFRAVDGTVLEAARSLGATPGEVTASVTLPLAFRGILAGALLSWSRAVSEIGGFLILAYAVYPSALYSGPVTSPISVYVFNLYQLGDLQGAAAVSSLLVLIALALFLAVRFVEGRGALPWARGALFP
jgi:molybdate/tungstate transport system permease protein